MTIIIAHRGGAGLRPENSLAAIDLALKLGVPAIEIDIHLAADGVPVVIHDAVLERTTEGSGEVAARSAAELGAVRLKGLEEGVPTLEAVLERMAGNPVELRLEIKIDAYGAPYADLLEAALALLARYGMVERTRLISFDWNTLVAARGLEAKLRLGALVGDGVSLDPAGLEPITQWMVTHDVDTLGPAHHRATPELRAALARAGRHLNVWTANEPTDMRRLLALPVDELTTDRPDLALSLLEARRPVSSPTSA